MCLCAGPAQADRSRAPGLLPAAGVHPAVQVLHSSVPPPPAAQPGAAASEPQGGEKVGMTARKKDAKNYDKATKPEKITKVHVSPADLP